MAPSNQKVRFALKNNQLLDSDRIVRVDIEGLKKLSDGYREKQRIKRVLAKRKDKEELYKNGKAEEEALNKEKQLTAAKRRRMTCI